MPRIVCYMPTYSPDTEAVTADAAGRAYSRLSQEQITQRMLTAAGRLKPWMYCDAIDSVVNSRPDVKLVVADGRSTESIRAGLEQHHVTAGGYTLEFYPEKMSQWLLFNDVLKKHTTEDTEYFIYSSSDVIWPMDWVTEAIAAFEKDPKLQILFPLVSQGDSNIPCQVATGPRDQDPIKPPYDFHGRAPVLNAYVMIFRIQFLRTYGGYPDIFRNNFTESFLSYLCDAMGGELRLLPRGWCFHHGLGDAWQENGSYYYFDQEKPKFDEIMAQVQMARAVRLMTPQFLKQQLYQR